MSYKIHFYGKVSGSYKNYTASLTRVPCIGEYIALGGSVRVITGVEHWSLERLVGDAVAVCYFTDKTS